MVKQNGILLGKIRKEVPLVHNITNYVTVNDCANVVLAIGASPVMADDINEVEDITGISSALVINIGTLNERTIDSMILAGKKANKLSIPIVFDPVGAGASAFRTETAKRILKEVQVSVIRGNLSEVMNITGTEVETKGVDSGAGNENIDKVVIAKKAALMYHCAICVTGVVDIVTDGVKIAKVHNGCSDMTKVTGTGCMTTAITGAFHGVTKNSFQAALAGVTAMGIAGEKACVKAKDQGTGSFRIEIINALSLMDASLIEEMAKIEEL